MLICLLGFSPILTAEMYKWIDAGGNTHYTQSPPPDGVASVIIKSPGKVDVEASQKSLSQRQKKANLYAEQRKKQADEKARREADKERDNKNCEISRANVASLERPRINRKDEQGNVYRVPEEERQER